MTARIQPGIQFCDFLVVSHGFVCSLCSRYFLIILTIFDVFFFFFFTQSTDGVQWFYYRENYTLPKIHRGSNIFQGGSNFLGGGVQMLISIEIHITQDFLGGVRTPYSPLNPHMVLIYIFIYSFIHHVDLFWLLTA